MGGGYIDKGWNCQPRVDCPGTGHFLQFKVCKKILSMAEFVNVFIGSMLRLTITVLTNSLNRFVS